MKSIGRHSYHAGDMVVRRWCDDERLVIGNFCSIAEDVTFVLGGGHRTSTVSTYPFDQKFGNVRDAEARSYKGLKTTTVGNDVWIATGAMIMPGVTIGDGAVISPGSVVYDDVAPYAVVRGNPAAMIRRRFHETFVEALLKIKWWDWGDELIRERRNDFYLPVKEFMEKYS